MSTAVRVLDSATTVRKCRHTRVKRPAEERWFNCDLLFVYEMALNEVWQEMCFPMSRESQSGSREFWNDDARKT